MPRSKVIIIGAGPYGISIAAHLRSVGVDLRIFGKPMDRWQNQMPKGMFLKSEGNASSLSDASGQNTLARYCAGHGLPYADRHCPIPLDVFAQYASSFQRTFVPDVEKVMVRSVAASPRGFELQLENGETASAEKIVVATGLDHCASVPQPLAGLPPALVSHSSEHRDLSQFNGRDVTVIGGGQSALETAALLAEQGASVRLLVRKPALAWNAEPGSNGDRPFHERLRSPSSALGQGLELWFCSQAPMVFRHLPQRVRFERVACVLGPSGAWWLKDRVVGKVQLLLEHSVRSARVDGDRVTLNVDTADGRSSITTDHVIAATGYRFDVQRLPFLSSHVKSQIQVVEQQPVLSSHFESSVPGLHFTGLASASCFGPAMRFLHGAHFTSRRLAAHLANGRYVREIPVLRPADTPTYKQL